MGLLSRIKNSVTGGWADVNLSTSPGSEPGTLLANVGVTVRSEDISVSEVYVKLVCREVVDLKNYHIRDGGNGDSSTLHIKEHVDVYNQRFAVAPGQELAANSSHNFEALIPLPAGLPKTYNGRHVRMEWRIIAGLDMKGNDPDCGWMDLHLE